MVAAGDTAAATSVCSEREDLKSSKSEWKDRNGKDEILVVRLAVVEVEGVG